MFERIEICGVLSLLSSRVEDTGGTVSRKRRGAAGHEPRRPLVNPGACRLGERRNRVPEDERFGKRDLERAQTAAEAPLATEEVAGSGACRRLLPLRIGGTYTGSQSID